MILNRQTEIRVPLKPLKQFLRKLQRETKTQSRGVTVCLVKDGQIARWNREYRGISGPTDVLSFPSPGAARQQGRSPRRAAATTGELGDIAIAPATARRYARKNGRTLENELKVLMLHGVLHLLGFDHESDSGQMERLEQRLRRRLGLER